ncbi:DUF1302 family protein [Marinobacter salinisoli]|nr:DUF1302 family protein [Marinobacter salinisoli]
MTTKNNLELKGRYRKQTLLAAGIVAATMAGVPQTVSASEEDWLTKDWEVSGYIREYLSWNLENPTLIGPGPNIFDGEQRDDYRYDLSMARTVGKLNLFRDFGNARFKFTGRISRESPTDYLKDLQAVADEWAQTGGASGSSVNLRDDVYDDEEIRELWVQGDITDTTNLKVGRQQVVWGETDFFQLLDVVHGYDFRWRSFLEPENEELRKPLNLVNLVQRVDDLDGSLQLLYIPGRLNDGENRGNSYDVEGGRWANNPNKGITFASAPFAANVPYNYDHSEADMDDDSYGLRWNGLAGDWGYSVAWFHGPNPNPVANPNPATNPGRPDLQTNPYEYEGNPAAAGEFIYPYIDIFGVTANNYFAGPDLVFSTEIAYIPDAPYNVGIAGGAAGLGAGEACGFFPGFCGIAEKSLVRSMFRIDKQLDLQDFLGTSRPSFFTVQLFNNWITDFEREEQLVNLAGFGGETKEFSSIITAVLATNYANDQINPSLAVGSDLTYGGGFVIPAVEMAYGDHIRVRLEADIFWHETDQDRPLEGFNDTNLFGYFSGNDQLTARLTYQF